METSRAEIALDSTCPMLNLTWTRTGGIAGLKERLWVLVNGEAILENLESGESASLVLTPSEH